MPARVRGLAALLAVGGLLLAGCGSGGADGKGSGSSAQAIAAGEHLRSTWPLTGLPVTGQETSAQTHPVMVLKMDNTYASAPQMGLGSADMVVEELVEGGLTRLASFYYSKIPGDVGPVRSMRASDIGIVSPVHADVVTSGAAPITIRRIHGAGIRYFTEGAKGFYRDNARPAPYNLFTDLRGTTTLAQGKPARPADYLPWGTEQAFGKGGARATHLTATFSGGHTTDWAYRDGHYLNTNSNAAAGDQFRADNVLVLRVQVGDAGYLDPAGNHVPETHLIGKGAAMLFHHGALVRGTWTKKALGSTISLSTASGPLTVPAGHTWIELVPASGGNVTFGK